MAAQGGICAYQVGEGDRGACAFAVASGRLVSGYGPGCRVADEVGEVSFRETLVSFVNVFVLAAV